jgi:hypothetical protein
MKTSSLRLKSEIQFLLITGALVLVLGISGILSLLREPEAQAMVPAKKIETRTPASANAKTESPSLVESSNISATSLLRFDCERNQLKEDVSASYVRLAGTPCGKAEDLEVVNKTNGFSAAVIFTPGGKFTTDFIDLQDGENQLEVTETQSNGTKVSRLFQVIRHPAGSSRH